jgi:hypothetical protein
MTSRSCGVGCVVLLALLGEGSGHAISEMARPARIGFLPVTGDPTLVGILEAELHAELERPPNDSVMLAERLVHELRRASVAARRTALQLIESAEEAAFRLQRTEALRLARAAMGNLRKSAGWLSSPRQLARAHVSVALALLLKPTDPAQALAELQAAFAVHPTYIPDQDRLPPRALRLAKRARAQHAQYTPATDDLAAAARLGKVQTVVWLGVRSEGGQVRLQYRRYDATRGTTAANNVMRLNPVGWSKEATGLILHDLGLSSDARAGRGAEARQPVRRSGGEFPSQRLDNVPTAPQPHGTGAVPSSRLWSWVAAGGAIAALATGVGLRLSAESDRSAWEALEPTRANEPEGDRLERSYKTKAWAANGLFITAGALAITSTVLFLIEGRMDAGAHNTGASTPRFAPMLGDLVGADLCLTF